MRTIFYIVVLALAGAMLSACKPEDKLVGRWESETWKYFQEPIFIQFSGDGTWYGTSNSGKNSWNIEKEGYIRIVYPLGGTGRCRYSFTSDGSLEITTGYCFNGVQGLPETVVLKKQ
ncbi:UNVERIFIED_ORG: hypothetical protein J2W19_004679 [Shinella zoogloeoides]|nr:hypothetical protein [Shinella zoogloeoides]